MICLTMTKKVREVLVLQMLARNADARAASPCPRGAGRCRPAPPTPAPPLSAVGVTAVIIGPTSVSVNLTKEK